MANSAAQDNRIPRVDYEFTCDEGPSGEFRVYRFHLVEELNRPYEMRLDLLTREVTAEVDQFLSSSCELLIAREAHARSVFGIITSVEYLGHNEDSLLVSVTVVPAFALLRQQTHSRIFQEMSVLDIVEEVLGSALGDYSRSLNKGAETRGTRPRDYCVQYNESDFDFVSRLLEQEGISYRFEHDVDAGHEVLTLAYANNDYPELYNVTGDALYPIIARGQETADVESFQSFDLVRRLTTTSAWRRDYDFLTPMQPLDEQQDEADTKGYDRRIYTHMRRRYVSDDLADRNQDQLEAAQQEGAVIYADGNGVVMEPGKVFELERHTRADLETQFVVTRVVHSGICPEELLSEVGEGTRYENRIQCMKLETPVRPPQRTRKPRVLGPQTGIVAGPSGEEIHTDEHGRIMVQMHWEEETTYDDTSSCWIRVAQSWAGPGWGTQFIPRVGMEVVVSFLEGNPDRPLVTGCVYNGDNASPYTVPDNKTQSGWRTDSVGGDGFNMIRFEDTSGSEEFYIHAQKDKNIEVLNSCTTTIGNDDTLSVGHDRAKDVGNDQTESVTNNKTITVGVNHTETIGSNENHTVGVNSTHTIGSNNTITVGGKQDVTIAMTDKKQVGLKSDEIVGAMKSVKVGGLYSEQVGASRSITAVGAFSITAGLTGKFQCAKSITIKAQDKLIMSSDKEMEITAGKPAKLQFKDDLELKGDKKSKIEVADEITIKCGSASVLVKKSGDITIKGNKITVKGSGAVTIKGSKVNIN